MTVRGLQFEKEAAERDARDRRREAENRIRIAEKEARIQFAPDTEMPDTPRRPSRRSSLTDEDYEA